MLERFRPLVGTRVLPFAFRSLRPKRILDRLSDNRARLSLIESDRCLLHVAATRAKKEVLVTYYGQPSELLGC
jgi:superfamily I DNA/RNA helicase